MMEIVKVRITGSSGEAYWYSKLIGEVFTVYKDRKEYILKEDYDRGHEAWWGHISKRDCVELGERGLNGE